MMNRPILLAGSFTISLAAVAYAASIVCAGPARAQADLVELTVRVTGIARPAGALAIAIFDDAAAWEALADPVARAFVPVAEKSVSWAALLPRDGEYAAVVYHDVNGNGELDRGRFGIPREPYGFSNDARAPFGPPGFAAASFSVSGAALAISIELR